MSFVIIRMCSCGNDGLVGEIGAVGCGKLCFTLRIYVEDILIRFFHVYIIFYTMKW